jgi:hypothetical protein
VTVERDQADNLLRLAAVLSTRAEFVVVGGCALMLHGHDHLPPDLDLVPEPSAQNLRRLFDAIASLGIGHRSPLTDHVLATREIVTCVTTVGAVDLLLERGREEYHALSARSTVMARDVRVAAVADVLELRARFGKVAIDA